MKQPKKLTMAQKKRIAKEGENPKEWMLMYEGMFSYCYVHKKTGERRILAK